MFNHHSLSKTVTNFVSEMCSFFSQFPNSNQLLCLFVLATTPFCSSAGGMKCGENRSLISFKHHNFIVLLNPYIISSNYMHVLSDEGLISMIKKIRFEVSSIAVDILYIPFNRPEYLVPYAVAKYNKAFLTPSSSLRKPTSAYLFFNPWQKQEIIKLADEANDIYPGTIEYLVSTFVFKNETRMYHPSLHSYFNQSLTFNNSSKYNYKLGALLPFSICEMDNTTRKNELSFLGDLHLAVFQKDFGPDDYAVGAEKAFEYLTAKLEKCRDAFKSDISIELALQANWQGENPFSGFTNYSVLLSFLERAANWSVESNTKVFLKGEYGYPRMDGWGPPGDINRYHLPHNFTYLHKVFVKTCKNEKIYTSTELNLPEDFDFKQYNFIVNFSAKFGTKISNFSIPDNTKIISVLATEFIALSPIMQDIKEISLPLAVAYYNKLFRNVTNPLKMYLSVDDKMDYGKGETFKDSLEGTKSILNVAVKANSIFPNTVDFILFKTNNYSFTGRRISRLVKYARYKNQTIKLGLILPLVDCLFAIEHLVKEFMLLRNVQLLIPFIKVNKEYLGIGLDTTVNDLFMTLQQCQDKLWDYNVFAEVALGTQISDYDSVQRVQNYSNLVSFWGKVNSLSKKTNTKVFIREAFDNIGNKVDENYGWWKLAVKPRWYQIPADFVYEDKTEQNKRLYSEQIPLVHNTPFKISNVAMTKNSNLCVCFSPLLRKEDNWKTYNEEELVPILRKISTIFSAIYASPINTVNGVMVSPIPTALARLNRNKTANHQQLRLYLKFRNTKFDNNKNGMVLRYPDGLDLAEAAKALHPSTEIIFVGELMEMQMMYDHDNYSLSVLKETKKALESKKNGYKQGALFPIRKCGFGSTIPFFTNTEHPEDFIDLIIFELHPEEEDFEVGVQESIKWFIIVFERCKDKLEKLFNFTKVGFMTSWPEMNLYSGENVEGLIIFWERMSAWAEESNTMVIIKEAFDSPSVEKKDAFHGWWRLFPNESYKSSSDYIFEEKREAYLRQSSNSTAEDKHSIANSVLLAVFLGVTVLLLIAVILFLFNRNKRSRYLTEEEINEFLKGNPEDAHAPFKSFYDAEKFELLFKEFSVNESELLGSGQFGNVCRGSVKKGDEKRMDVAVKTTKRPCRKSALNGILSEIKTLQYLKSHPNLVGVVGAYTAELNRGKVFIFLEMCSGGSLEKHLRGCKAKIEAENPDCLDELAINLTQIESQLENDLRRWSIEIRRGLEYIATRKIVHMDIATRNVLLTNNKIAKISDFGLSRRLYNYELYVKSGQEPLPWRWLAPESLLQSEFTEKTDVWAFGVTLWEIFTLGDLPYSGLSYNINFGECLRRGIRLGMPTYNKDDIYSVMGSCWALNPENRPTFSELRTALEKDENFQVENAERVKVASTVVNEYDKIK